MKLREEPGAEAHLIAYERPDLRGHKESRYWIVAIDDPGGLREALGALLGLRAVVSKTRRLFVFEGVRIHLDQVDGLGTFIELEGVAAGDTEPSQFERPLTDLRRAFEIAESDLMRGSYCDLISS